MSTTAISTLREAVALEGEDLFKLGRASRVITRGQLSLDKGWANRTVRAALNGDSAGADVHVVALRRACNGTLRPRYALALSAINAETIQATPFGRSALRAAMDNMVLIAREEASAEAARRRSRVLGAARFSLSESSFAYRAVERDYELVRRAVRSGAELNGSMGALVQPRTKGKGGEAARTFAFYARPDFVATMLGL